MKIALIACCSKKLEGKHKVQNIYISTLFKYSFRFASKYAHKTFILSAKYGLLDTNSLISSYNVTLNSFSEADKKKWAESVYKQLLLVSNSADEFIWLAGSNYRKYLMQFLSNTHFEPLKGLGIGSQVKWLKERI